MRYAIGAQEAITLTLVDETGAPVTGETLTGFAKDPAGTSYPLTSTNPSANNYRVQMPTFDRPGRWWAHGIGTTPGVGFEREFLVNANPAAPVPP